MIAHLDLQALQVEQEVDDDLAGAMVGDLAAPVDLDDGDADIAQDVLALAGLAQREHGRMLDHPQFVGSFRCPPGGEFLHRAPGWFVIDPAETADLHPQSTTLTSGCAVRSMYSASSCAFEVATTVHVRPR